MIAKTRKKRHIYSESELNKRFHEKNVDKSNRFETGRNAKIMNAHFVLATMERHCMNNVCI